MLCVSGHDRPPRLAVVAALARGHATVDRAAGHHAADRARSSAEEAAAKHLAANHRAGDATGHLAGRG